MTFSQFCKGLCAKAMLIYLHFFIHAPTKFKTEYGPSSQAEGSRPYSRSRAEFFPTRTHLDRQITCLFLFQTNPLVVMELVLQNLFDTACLPLFVYLFDFSNNKRKLKSILQGHFLSFCNSIMTCKCNFHH